MRPITEDEFRALEAAHGPGMVVVLSAGEDDYAFRRPREIEVQHVLESFAEQKGVHHEECALLCLLSPEAPLAGKSPEEDRALSADERQALVDEKLRLRGLWKTAPCIRDTLSLGLAEACGWNAGARATSLGGGRYSIAVSDPETSTTHPGLDLRLTARIFAEPEYKEYRRRLLVGDEGAAERYAWDKLIDQGAMRLETQEEGEPIEIPISKADIGRLHPYLVIAIGRLCQGLGAEGRTVRPKKYPSGSGLPPGASSAPPAKTEI